MFTALLHIHSLLRYGILILLLLAIIQSVRGWLGRKGYTSMNRKLTLFTMIFTHTQLLVGLLLYFISPTVKVGLANMGAAMKDASLRFWTVEHSSMMLIAVAFITLGNIRSKKATSDEAKHKQVTIFFLVALVIILASIPWPWSSIARGWMPGM
jgi:hypothetical protein